MKVELIFPFIKKKINGLTFPFFLPSTVRETQTLYSALKICDHDDWCLFLYFSIFGFSLSVFMDKDDIRLLFSRKRAIELATAVKFAPSAARSFTLSNGLECPRTTAASKFVGFLETSFDAAL